MRFYLHHKSMRDFVKEKKCIFHIYLVCCLFTLGLPRGLNKIQNSHKVYLTSSLIYVPFGVTYEKIGTIQRRLAWPLHKDDTLSRSGRSTDLNIYFGSFTLDLFRQNTFGFDEDSFHKGRCWYETRMMTFGMLCNEWVCMILNNVQCSVSVGL